MRVLADNTGYRYQGSSGIKFSPHRGEGALCVIDGLPDNYLETESFAEWKGWVDAINHNLYAFDIMYTSDMRTIEAFNSQIMVMEQGRALTSEDTDACVVSEDLLKEYNLSIGDSISAGCANRRHSRALLCAGHSKKGVSQYGGQCTRRICSRCDNSYWRGNSVPVYQEAFYALGVKGTAAGFVFSSALDISKSPLVKDFYCYENFGVRVQGTKDNIPMTITSDLTRNLGDNCTVNYVEGYDVSAFEGTGQLCLVGEELAEELGISPGDEIDMLSSLLYSMLNMGENGAKAIEKGYKTYKVIGIVESDDANINKGIFAGIRSDLQKLFSMDFPVVHCEFTLADNDRLEELDALLMEERGSSYMYSPYADYHLDSGGLTDIERIRGLLESLFPIAVAAAVLIGLFGAFLVILQSAQEAAFLRILGVTKKRARCMLVFEQVVLCIAGIVLVVGGIALSRPGLFAGSVQTLAPCFGLYFMGCVCGATVAAIQVTRGKILELLQVKE